ncbi:MAG: bifunctional riboflavin kinase/FAD synthetase [Clostridia bacterium]|nr:bifunctional riboflavin kinase/FAD synthetase [Clostridia bacterium]
MEVYEFFGTAEGTAICLGDFDGVHTGHRQVLLEASKTGDWGVLLFTHNSKGEKEILTLLEKLAVLKKLGAKYAVSADFKEELKEKSPEEFVQILKELKVKSVAVGYDYRFGKNAVGDIPLLKSLCSEYGMEVVTAEAKTFGGEPVKSTKIRELIKSGDIKKANILLGSPYMISGKVCKGLGNGTDMGIPTANIEAQKDKLLPKDGVYSGSVGGKKAVINVGKNPTFSAEKRTVEVHIIGEKEDLYGKSLTVEFLDRIRDEIKFRDKNDLILQIKKDIKSVKEEF